MLMRVGPTNFVLVSTQSLEINKTKPFSRFGFVSNKLPKILVPTHLQIKLLLANMHKNILLYQQTL